MIAAGINPKALSTYMGHSSITITLDRYGHLLPGNETEAAHLLDTWLQQHATAGVTEHLHGKEGVDGSSPSEGSAKVQHVGAFAFSPTCRVGSVRWVWSRLWSFRVDEPLPAWPVPLLPRLIGSIRAVDAGFKLLG